MGTRIEVDEQLISEAMQTGRFASKKEAVEASLRRMIQLHEAYQGLLAMRGKVHWAGDDDEWSDSEPEDSAFTGLPPVKKTPPPVTGKTTTGQTKRHSNTARK